MGLYLVLLYPVIEKRRMRQSNFKDWILFEDEDLIVIHKPPYISTLKDRTGADSVLELATEYHKNCQVCHRLDKETSGALLLAKHPQAYKHVNIQFAERTVEKIYHAVAEGVHELKDMEIDLPLLISASGMVRVAKAGKTSTTIVGSLSQYKNHTLVACKPVTGRMHQIRVHMAAIGAPLVADETYGGKQLYLSAIKKKYRPKATNAERPLMRRVALHAYSLKFNDLNDENQHIKCPYPKDFRTVISQLTRNS